MSIWCFSIYFTIHLHKCINVYLLLLWHFDIFNLVHVYNNIHLEAFSLNNLKQVIPHQRRADMTSDWQVCPNITNHKCLFVNLGHYISPVSCHSINHIFMCSLLSLPTVGVFCLFFLKLEVFSCFPNMATYGGSNCGNYLCHLLWTYSIWVSSPNGNSLKRAIWVMKRRSRWQCSGKINQAWCIFPTSTCRQMWFNAVIGFTSSSSISVDE